MICGEKDAMPNPQALTMREKHPELFLPPVNMDRRQRTRLVPMEVMNLGFPRTGTMCKSFDLRLIILHEDTHQRVLPTSSQQQD